MFFLDDFVARPPTRTAALLALGVSAVVLAALDGLAEFVAGIQPLSREAAERASAQGMWAWNSWTHGKSQPPAF